MIKLTSGMKTFKQKSEKKWEKIGDNRKVQIKKMSGKHKTKGKGGDTKNKYMREN